VWVVWQHYREAVVCILALRWFKWDCSMDFRWPVNTCLKIVVLEAQGDAV
jgi:hypothetical protein